MQKIFLFAIAICCFHNFSLTQQIVTGNFMERPFTVRYINEITGYAGGSNEKWIGELRKTTDGGKNWVPIYSNTNAIFANIWLFDQNNILISGGGKLFRTTNSGNSWFTIFVPAQVSLTAICFVNENTGFLSGYGFFNPAFLKSTDGGYGWRNLTLDTNLDLGDVDFINENTGYAVGNRIVLKTTNGGETITQSIFSYYYLFSVDAIDSNIAYAAGYITNSNNCLILKTENSGKTWFENYINSSTNLNVIKFINPVLGFATGDNGIILKTADGGLTWKEQVFVDTCDFYDIFFLNENTGWVVGQIYPGGLLYKTTNAGENWSLQNTLTEKPTEFSILQNYPNPFNPTKKIKFKLGNPSKVDIKVYDIQGKEIKTLVKGTFETGVYEVEFDGSNLSNGVYLYKIDATTLNTIVIKRYTESKKMVLIK